MSDQSSFAELMVRVRAGDTEASNELLTKYGPAVQRAARMRMFNARLRRVFESGDIANSVMKSFLIRIVDEGNEWKIEEPSDLANLLASMAENKVVDKVRYVKARVRGGDKETGTLGPGIDLKDRNPSPAEIAEIKEEAKRCWDLLDQDARALYEMRYDKKCSWDEMGRFLGSSGEAVRKKLVRTLADVRQQLTKKDASG